MAMADLGPARAASALGSAGYDSRTDKDLVAFVGQKPVSWSNKAFKPRWH
jgi:hypothetical protein